MNINKKRANLVETLARKELKREKREKAILLFFWTFTLFSLAVLLIFLSTKLIMTGYSSYVESKGGYITEIEITKTLPTTYWAGLYGLALRVPGFTELLYTDSRNPNITRKDLLQRL